MAFPDAWEEEALIGVTPQADTLINMAASTKSIDIDAGDKDIEGQANLAGGRVEKWTPEADTTITFEGWITNISTADYNGIAQWFHTTDSYWDTTQPLRVDNSTNRDKFNICILWTNDPTATSAASAVSLAKEGLRFIAVNCRLISFKPSMTNSELMGTWKFKVPAFQKNGDSNIRWQSTDSSATLAAPTSLGGVSLGAVQA